MDDDIVLFQILPRLPGRSIGRFMSVSKQWHSFLKTPVFTKMHLHHVNNQNHPKMLAVSAGKRHRHRYFQRYFQTIDCETPEVGLSADRSLPFETNNRRMRILSSLNGLVCVAIGYFAYMYSDIILWNPLTGDYKTMSKDSSLGNFFIIDDARGYGLYYSSCEDDYKLLHVTQSSDAYIYSWKSESWRKAKSRVDSLMLSWCCSCFLNEKLYFIAQGIQGSSSNEWLSTAIRFDTKTETFTEITTPSPSASGDCYCLMVVEGCIHLCLLSKLDNDLIKLELWKMDGDEEWTEVIRSCTFPFVYRTFHLMKNGNLLQHSSREVFVFEVDRKEAKEAFKYTIDIDGPKLLYEKFVETIVSLKR